jgi:hypothetical protein
VKRPSYNRGPTGPGCAPRLHPRRVFEKRLTARAAFVPVRHGTRTVASLTCGAAPSVS